MWLNIALIIISFIAVRLLTPKPEEQKPAVFADFDTPIAEEGASIPVLFGTRDIMAPNVVWYGDLDYDPIRKKQGKKG